MAKPFTRQLGPRSGVQLNPIIDQSERFVAGNADQVFATTGRFTRGRIDKAFRVNRGNLFRKLGQPQSPTINRLNETLVQIYEAFRHGAYEAVVHRLVPAAAELKWMVCDNAPDPANVWSVQSDVPANYLLAVKHLECFNEGVRAEIHAEAVLAENLAATATANVPLAGSAPLTIGGVEVEDGDRVKLSAQTDPEENGTYTVAIAGGNYTLTAADPEVPVPSKVVTLRLVDLDGTELYSFEGSLDPTAKDEFGESRYLPIVVSATTDEVEVVVAEDAEVDPTSSFYGVDGDGARNVTAADLVYFTEGGTTYSATDIDKAMTSLKYTDASFGYLSACGSRSTALISKLIELGKEINTQVIWSVPGDLSPAAAITFYNQLNIDTHYSQCYWAPLRAVDPLNGGKDVIGTDGIQVGYRCARNARTDANGVPPKNYPIAGKDWPITRVGIEQVYLPDDQELDDLARARINPVIFQRYNSGSSYVFSDSLTGAKTEGDRKLIAVADMSSQVDDWVTAAMKEYLQLPMSDTIRRGTDFLESLFQGLESARWLVPSQELDGRSYVATVEPNAQRPKDRVDVKYWLSYDGTTRAIYVQQTISK